MQVKGKLSVKISHPIFKVFGINEGKERDKETFKHSWEHGLKSESRRKDHHSCLRVLLSFPYLERMCSIMASFAENCKDR
jgi:hypothetical protein